MWFIYLLFLKVSLFAGATTCHHLSAHLVSLRTLRYVYQPGDHHFCTGVILTERHVLTSAHCITGKRGIIISSKRITVAVDLPLLNSPETLEFLVEVENIMKYPKYRKNWYHDLALLKLRKSIKFDGHHLANVSLGSSELEIGRDCKAIGGISINTRRHTHTLLVTNVSLRPLEECKRVSQIANLRHIQHRVQELVCVASLNYHACLSDIGGPLFCNGQLYGIAMGRINCSGPIFFTYLPHYHSWLKKMISRGVKLRLHHKWIFFLLFLSCI
ncbi:hypothetical protein KR032_003115, partial [Drosophila birchii]